MVKYEKVIGHRWTDEMKHFMSKLRETSRQKIYREIKRKLVIWSIYKHTFVYKEDDSELVGLQLQKKYRKGGEECSDDEDDMENELDKKSNDADEAEFNEAEFEENLDKIECKEEEEMKAEADAENEKIAEESEEDPELEKKLKL